MALRTHLLPSLYRWYLRPFSSTPTKTLDRKDAVDDLGARSDVHRLGSLKAYTYTGSISPSAESISSLSTYTAVIRSCWSTEPGGYEQNATTDFKIPANIVLYSYSVICSVAFRVPSCFVTPGSLMVYIFGLRRFVALGSFDTIDIILMHGHVVMRFAECRIYSWFTVICSRDNWCRRHVRCLSTAVRSGGICRRLHVR